MLGALPKRKEQIGTRLKKTNRSRWHEFWSKWKESRRRLSVVSDDSEEEEEEAEMKRRTDWNMKSDSRNFEDSVVSTEPTKKTAKDEDCPSWVTCLVSVS